jgi:hypothetical protein
MMSREFEMSMIDELNFFHGFQIKQMDHGTFVSQDKYLKNILKKFDMENCKPNKTPMATNTHLNLNVKGANPTLVVFSDFDFAGSLVDRKSTSGACHFLRRSLVSWSSKKQNLVALSIAKAESIAVDSCFTQILYLKQSLVDYNIKLNSVPLLCGNESVVKIVKTPVLHSRTKHIDIRHHFLREKEANGDIALQNVRSEEQLADIFTKPLNERIFMRLRNELNVLDATHVM